MYIIHIQFFFQNKINGIPSNPAHLARYFTRFMHDRHNLTVKQLFTENKTMKVYIFVLALLLSPTLLFADETTGRVTLRRKTVEITDEQKELKKPRLLKAGGGYYGKGKGGKKEAKGKNGKGADDCSERVVVAKRDEILNGATTGALGEILQFPVYDPTTMEQIGIYQDAAASFGDDKCVFNGAVSVDWNSELESVR